MGKKNFILKFFILKGGESYRVIRLRAEDHPGVKRMLYLRYYIFTRSIEQQNIQPQPQQKILSKVIIRKFTIVLSTTTLQSVVTYRAILIRVQRLPNRLFIIH